MNALRRLSAVALLALGAAAQDVAPRPNILWITCEDISPHVGCYGDPYAVTPNIDALAAQGVRYTRAFAPIGVCAPSRSTLILGAMASSVGSQHMRCAATLPEAVRCFPQYLRQAGYHCTNNVKTDYNFDVPKEAWTESSAKAHWKSRKPGQPFFAVFNFVSCHESQIRLPEEAYRKRIAGFAPHEIHDPAKAPLPPYHPDAPELRRDWARYADAITFMDKEVGRILKELDDDGLGKDTIVFFFSDHGAGMPRSKRWLYDSSLRVPMIVRAPGMPAGTTSDRLISFVDYGPTVLSLAGVGIPPAMQGRPFLGAAAAPPREFVFGFRDRMDERVDLLRCVRDAKYKYIRNYMPQRPWAQHLAYMYEMPSMKAWQRLHDEGKLDAVQRRFFEAKPFEELYDTDADPHEIANLAGDAAMAGTLDRLRRALDAWMLEIRDLGFLPESDLRTRFGTSTPYDAVRERPGSYPLEKLMAAAALAARRDPSSRGPLVELAGDADPAVRYWAVTGLLALGAKEDVLRKALSDVAPAVRIAAAEALGTEEALPALAAGLKDPNEWVRHAAALAVDALGARAASLRPAVRELAGDRNEYVKRVAEHILKGRTE
jgi:N-sulfoglucosamine sulfohydrolase